MRAGSQAGERKRRGRGNGEREEEEWCSVHCRLSSHMPMQVDSGGSRKGREMIKDVHKLSIKSMKMRSHKQWFLKNVVLTSIKLKCYIIALTITSLYCFITNA